jgi:hypothetical protein
MASRASSVAKSGRDPVVVASFDSYRRAEHMLASLGRGFRGTTRKGGTTAVVVTGNADGSLRLAQSRVLTASSMVSALIDVSLSWLAGFMGLFSMLRGQRARSTPLTCIKGTSDRVRTVPARSSPKLARMRPSWWLAARTRRRGRWSPRQRPAMRKAAGMARSQSFLPPPAPAALTIGCAPQSASPPARTARPTGS